MQTRGGFRTGCNGTILESDRAGEQRVMNALLPDGDCADDGQRGGFPNADRRATLHRTR
jgi:hypothetical protein